MSGQAAWCGEKYRKAEESYGQYLRQCEAAAATMTGPARTLFQDTLLLQARIYALWAQVCGYLMSFARTLGEGPHYYEWMREFGDSEQDRRIMLILNTDNHPDDDTLWRLMEQRWGE